MPKDHATLQQELDAAARQVQVGGEYVHYKHPKRRYRLISLAIDEATEGVAVVYQALYDEQFTWIRPLANFTETVATDNGPTPRFSLA